MAESLESTGTDQHVPNYKVIHDVGEEVTKQFIAKVDEIGHSSSSSQGSIEDPHADDDLQRCEENVTANVTKQVEIFVSRNRYRLIPQNFRRALKIIIIPIMVMEN